MKLSKLDRQILANQHAILEKLDEQNADHHAHMQKVYQRGYAINYSDDFQSIYDEFGTEKSKFVVDVLDMYDSMQRGWKQNGSPEELKGRLGFPGFDGNNETEYMSYARFVIEDEGRWSNLEIDDFNSHMMTLPFYQKMLAAWSAKGTSERYDLSIEDINEILEARRAA